MQAETETAGILSKIKYLFKRWDFWLGILAISATFALAIVVVYYYQSFKDQPSYSYLGLFVVSAVGGATVIVPVPSLIVQFTMGAVLNPALVGAIAGFGSALGGTAIYLFGRGGRRVFHQGEITLPGSNHPVMRWIGKLSSLAKKKGSLAIFLMSAIFNPFFFPMAFAIGASRFKMWKFFTMCWAGNTVKSLLVAYLGYFGLGSILRAIGINV